MQKTSIFCGGANRPLHKLVIFILLVILMASGCTDKATEPNGTLGFADFANFAGMTQATDLPTENVWIIRDAAGTRDNFTDLRDALVLATTENRKIQLVFPNIVEIPQNAFDDNTSSGATLKSIVSVSAEKATTIGYNAFHSCTALSTVNLPEATTIGNNAFSECTALSTVNLPEATTIGYNAFHSCTVLIDVNLPKATTIGDNAFGNCFDLTTVSFPEATTIENYAFYKCTALTTMTIATKSSLTPLPTRVFSGIDANKITVTTASGNASLFTSIRQVIQPVTTVD